MDVHIGVDVGGTNTDAVVLKGSEVIGWAKEFTTQDVTSGVTRAITTALKNATNKTGTGWNCYSNVVHILALIVTAQLFLCVQCMVDVSFRHVSLKVFAFLFCHQVAV